MMKRSMLARHLIRFIGIGLFIYILTTIDFTAMVNASLSVTPITILGIAFLIIPTMVLKGARWQIISEGLGLRLKTTEATEALSIAQLANLATPGSLGDFIRVPYMTARGNPTDKSTLSIFIDAIISIVVPYSLGGLALLVLLEVDITILGLFGALLWFAGFILLYYFIKKTIWTWFFKARIDRLLSSGFRGSFLFTLPSVIKSVGKRNLLLSLGYSAVAWLTYTLQATVLAWSFGINVNWIFINVALALSTMATAIPISIQGLGIREGVFLFLFGLINIDPAIIVAFSLSLMLVNITPISLGLVSWARDPFDLTPEERPNESIGELR
ncbi:flippase-like domain-containing protein [Candidatus Thorarchaeota archaeon]|nr:MAG: flippase-like domain-containing protein [Candidatus Thorarchaeota archaeon]